MGNRYEVYSWRTRPGTTATYYYEEVCRGESFMRALWTAWRLKRNGEPYVKIEWR